MDSPKYLIIITLIDGQNFSIPDGAPDKVEAQVFAEARFANESVLKSDPIKLTSANPEFVTELAWQLDKKSLHQLRVERRAIKLQVFLQTRELKKNNQKKPLDDDSSFTNKVELIGYTVIDIRSAQETNQPKFQWLPLLNPKFKKSSYNRPEVQLAVALSRIDSNSNGDKLPLSPVKNLGQVITERSDSNGTSVEESRLYTTCLDVTMNSESMGKDEIIDNDIQIKSKDGCFYVYDTRHPEKFSMEDCNEKFKITITIPFNSELDTLTSHVDDTYYFSASLFGAIKRTEPFEELTSVETKELEYIVYSSDTSIISVYFELNSSLVIKLHRLSGETLGMTTIQLEQLCGIDAKCRSIEGIFALQSTLDHNGIPSSIHPTIGVSVTLEKLIEEVKDTPDIGDDQHVKLTKEHFGDDIDEYLYKSLNNTHQLTMDETEREEILNITIEDTDRHEVSNIEDHHFCFSIDLKNFSYTSSQKLIPILRELVVRYSYPFFGYKDTITTDSSIPVSQTNSIIVSGFCEFNFATTTQSLLLALEEIPLELDILSCEPIERIVGSCNLNLAQALCLNEKNCGQLQDKGISAKVSAPIHGLNDDEIGELHMHLCLKDLGEPTYELKSSIENNQDNCLNKSDLSSTLVPSTSRSDTKILEEFIAEAKSDLDSWREEFSQKFTEELQKRESEQFRRMIQRMEAKDAKRDLEFKKKMDELAVLERKLKNSFIYVESLERKLSHDLETLDSKISKAVSDFKKIDSLPVGRSLDDNEQRPNNRISSKMSSDVQMRRSSLKTPNNNAGIPLPTRSSSLIRNPVERSSIRLVKRPTSVVTTVINGTRPRLNLSKETQEKLASLRREKAELLKRGCRSNDELIQEINALIEKLAC